MSKKYNFLSKKGWLCQWKKYYEIVNRYYCGIL